MIKKYDLFMFHNAKIAEFHNVIMDGGFSFSHRNKSYQYDRDRLIEWYYGWLRRDYHWAVKARKEIGL